MAEPLRALSNVDRLIHEPARLTILTALTACHSADFVYLHSLTGLSLGNLSQHLTKLEAAGFITIEKTFVKKRPRTVVQLTTGGRQAIDEHWRRLDEARQSATELRVKLELVPQE